jgi:predicted Fe-Mo cluster-binding NifX family protein
MKVAVTAQGTDMTSQVDARFGRSRFFVAVDTETGEFEATDNAQNMNAVQGAGIQAARNVIGLDVAAVVTGHVGPKAFSTLQAAGVDVYLGAAGSVGNAVQQFMAGELERAGQADVEGHWT